MLSIILEFDVKSWYVFCGQTAWKYYYENDNDTDAVTAMLFARVLTVLYCIFGIIRLLSAQIVTGGVLRPLAGLHMSGTYTISVCKGRLRARGLVGDRSLAHAMATLWSVRVYHEKVTRDCSGRVQQ